MAKIVIDDDLYDRIKTVSEEGGYSSVDEFVTHLIENTLESCGNDENAMERMKGLGHIS